MPSLLFFERCSVSGERLVLEKEYMLMVAIPDSQQLTPYSVQIDTA